MTIIRFEYKTNYHLPATGGLVFMPHRKHAANETTILPKPFTKSLVDGVVEVDLEPTGDDWVWSVTLGNDTNFYAIPDHPGIINHTDLIPIAPSTLDFRVEPSWWAELRQLQTFITEYIDESRTNITTAQDTINSIHTTLQTAVADAQRHESVAGAYSRQAQASATSAWEASKGPDGAAQRAKDEADRAEIYRNEANTHRIEAGVEADRAETHATTAQTAAQDAKDDADRAQTEAKRAEAIADDWQSLQDAVNQAAASASASATNATNAAQSETNAATSESNASNHVATIENLIDTFAILESPNGTQYRITVDDDGELATELVEDPTP